MEDKTPPEGIRMFEEEPEVEIIGGPTLDEKLDKIIELLKRNEQEHQEIKDSLEKIEANQELLRTSYQEHGTLLASLLDK